MPRVEHMKTYPLYLNNEWVTSDATVSVINPATGEAFAKISAVGRDRVARALRDAQTAFMTTWRSQTGKARGEFLQKIASEVERRQEEIARLMTLENGKPLAQSQPAVP